MTVQSLLPSRHRPQSRFRRLRPPHPSRRLRPQPRPRRLTCPRWSWSIWTPGPPLTWPASHPQTGLWCCGSGHPIDPSAVGKLPASSSSLETTLTNSPSSEWALKTTWNRPSPSCSPPEPRSPCSGIRPLSPGGIWESPVSLRECCLTATAESSPLGGATYPRAGC